MSSVSIGCGWLKSKKIQLFGEITACFLQCCTTPDLKDERLRRVEFSTGTSVLLNAYKNSKKNN
jgi:hypothetical protein